MYKDKIPLAKPSLGKEEIKAVTSVLKSGVLGLGPKLGEFETEFAKYIGSKYAVAVNSGTSALHMCVKALGIGPGDEVITTPFSFVASSNPIIMEGARPVFVDIEEDTYNIDPEKIENVITSRTKALLIVHLFGRPCNMDKIMKIAKKHNLPVIEDACEAIGAKFKGKKVGTFGTLSVFAFYPNKQMTTGEGGMILTEDKNLYYLLRSLRNQGRNEDGEWCTHVRLGYNYRLDEMSCALGIEQLKKIPSFLKERKKIALTYIKELKKCKMLKTMFLHKDYETSWWVFFLQLTDIAVNREYLLNYLNERGISARAYFYPPIHLQTFYKEKFGYKKGDFPVAEQVSERGFVIPFFVGLKTDQIKFICGALNNYA